MWSLSVLLLGAGVAGSSSAASPLSAEQALAHSVTVSPGATCLEESRVEAHIQSWLGRPTVPANVRVGIRGDRVVPNRAAYSIVRAGKISERRFDALPENCDEAQAVVGLAVALALDDTLLERIEGDAPLPMRLVPELGVGISAPYGLSLGGSVGFGIDVSSAFSLQADALYQYSWGNRVEDTRGTFDAMVFGVWTRICSGGSVGGDIRLELCGGPAGGALRSAGHGYTVSRSAVGPWVVAMSGIRLGFSAGVRWFLDVDVVAPLFVPPIAVERSGSERSRDPAPTGLLVGFGPAFDL